MKILAIITSLLLISSAGWALNLKDQESTNPPQGAGSPCYSCTTTSDSTVENLRTVRNAVTAQSSVNEILNTNEDMNFSKKCENFISKHGLGKWGQTILNALNSNKHGALYESTDDLNAICPGFKELEPNVRELVWVTIITTMVNLESSCDEDETARGPNGKLIGLLQLHLNRENYYSNDCKRGAGRTPYETLKCGLAMLNKQLKNDQALFSRKSYWDVLRPQARSQKFRKVQAAVRKLSVCK